MTKKKPKRPAMWRRSPESQRKIQGLRTSSAASPHVPKPKKGTRSARRRQAIKDQSEPSLRDDIV